MTARSTPGGELVRLRQRARARGGPRLGAAPITVTVTVLSATRTRWTFSAPVARNAALTAVANYRTVPALAITSVTAGPGVAPTYVDVEHAEMVTGQAYTPIVERVEAA